MPGWLLVHSPLLGPGSWQPVARELRAAGDAVAVPDLRGPLEGPGPYAEPQAELAGLAGRAIERRDAPDGLVVVAHSGAGPLLPAVVDRVVRRDNTLQTPQTPTLQGIVYLDAGLPAPGRSQLETMPAQAAEQIRAMAVEGRLPPWPRWWPPELLAELLPDAEQRREVLEESAGVPLGWFEETLLGLELPAEVPKAYVRISEAYDGPADEATRLGWFVQRHDADHLAPLTRPVEVAAWLRTAVAGGPTAPHP